MQEITREQEAAIARLAIDHPSVAVAPQEDGTVKATLPNRVVLRLDEDGGIVPAPVTDEAYVSLPVPLLRRMLGDAVVEAALLDASAHRNPPLGLGMALGQDIGARIANLLHTERAVRECGLGVAPAEVR